MVAYDIIRLHSLARACLDTIYPEEKHSHSCTTKRLIIGCSAENLVGLGFL